VPTGVPGVDGVVAVAAGYKRPLPRPAPLLVRVPAALSTEFYSLSFLLRSSLASLLIVPIQPVCRRDEN
jgi:hypothetical protein